MLTLLILVDAIDRSFSYACQPEIKHAITYKIKCIVQKYN